MIKHAAIIFAISWAVIGLVLVTGEIVSLYRRWIIDRRVKRFVRERKAHSGWIAMP